MVQGTGPGRSQQLELSQDEFNNWNCPRTFGGCWSECEVLIVRVVAKEAIADPKEQVLLHLMPTKLDRI